MSTLLAELKRRKVFKVGAAYVVAAWLAVQAASIAFPAFEAPAWALRVFIFVLLLGFPIALVMSWILDATPRGLAIEAGSVGNGWIYGVASVLVALAIGWYLLGPGQEVNQPEPFSVTKNPAKGATRRPEMDLRPPAAALLRRKSIAVLPFADLSPARDQEYFSDGIAEELLNALVRIRDLKVAGRTSSFHYKGRNEDLRAIGKALGVAHILEGSVRKQGNKVRITAQLVQTEDGFHLWSETYDGDLTDIFELQERIARAITEQLEVVLQGEQKSRLVQVATSNTEAYALYLQASAVFSRRDFLRMGEAMAWLDAALELDPQFARGHARLAMIHAVGSVGRRVPGAAGTEAERHAKLAMKLDPSLAEPHVALSVIARVQRRFVEARVALDRALELDPEDTTANLYAAVWLVIAGYTAQGIDRLDRTLQIDPLMPNALNWRARQYLWAGDLDAAQRAFERADELGLSFAPSGLADVWRTRGDYAKARALLLPRLIEEHGCLVQPSVSIPLLLDGSLGGDARARARALAVVDECLAADPEVIPNWVTSNLMRLEQPARALEVIESGRSVDDSGVLMALWSPLGLAARRLPAFAAFARRVGLADAWESYGAPDGCRRIASREYVCE